VTRGRVSAVGIVPPLDVVEDGHLSLGLISEPHLLDQFALQTGEEALAQGVVVGIPHGPHGGADAGMSAAKPEGNGGILGGFNRSSQHRRSEWNSRSGRALPQGYSSPESFAAGCRGQGRLQQAPERRGGLATKGRAKGASEALADAIPLAPEHDLAQPCPAAASR